MPTWPSGVPASPVRFRVAEMPDAVARAHPADLRLVLLQALGTLSPSARAVLILRYWEDMSIEQTAAVLRCSPGNVKSQSSRALAQVRALLGDSVSELRLTD